MQPAKSQKTNSEIKIIQRNFTAFSARPEDRTLSETINGASSDAPAADKMTTPPTQTHSPTLQLGCPKTAPRHRFTTQTS